MRVSKWRLIAATQFPTPWQVFLIHYANSRLNTEGYWKAFLTGYMAGRDSMNLGPRPE